MNDPSLVALLVSLGLSPDLAASSLSAMFWLTVVTVVAAVPTGIVARQRGRSVALWVVFALSIPAIPLLLVWLLPDRSKGPR